MRDPYDLCFDLFRDFHWKNFVLSDANNYFNLWYVFHAFNRISIWDDGSLEIVNITKLDQGSYTCFAENNQGKANSTGTLEITGKTPFLLVHFT